MMKSSCIAGCVDAQNPVKVSLMKLHRWAEADAEFLRLVSISKDKESSSPNPAATPTRYESSIASRQRYLRSYTFSKQEEKSVAQRTIKWFKEKPKTTRSASKNRTSARGSCTFLDAVFNFLFTCVAKVDVHPR
ncbi:hypothetical protein L1049_024250 [Liquidambar formosana]|uniref:Uncharacterized protein n=1 Tax=Liquidambar formosana TaxID=63359 RepID=A0AAP0S1M8_LIQFO